MTFFCDINITFELNMGANQEAMCSRALQVVMGRNGLTVSS